MPERLQGSSQNAESPFLGLLHSAEDIYVQQPGTEILDSLEAASETESWEAHSFQELVQRQESEMQRGRLKKTNLAVIIGGPVYGKTFAGNQWEAEVLRLVAAQGGVEITLDDEDDTELLLYGEPFRLYDFEWVDAINVAIRLDLVEKKPFGMWTPDDTSIFTAIGGRAIEVIREGSSDLEGIEDNAVGLVTMKMPTITASGLGTTEEGYEYIGLDRGFNLLRQLQQDDDLADATFVLPLTTDRKSQHKRLLGRSRLNTVQTVDDLKLWFESSGIHVPRGAESYLGQLVHHLPQHSADVRAATQIAYQSDSVIRELAEQGGLSLSRREYQHIVHEIDLFDSGKVLTDPEVSKMQTMHMGIMANRFYPKLITDIGLNERPGHTFRALNSDVKSVTLHPRVMTSHNLIDTIWQVDPELLRVQVA